jgi:hypothetical protein
MKNDYEIQLVQAHQALSNHSLYQELHDLATLRLFMQSHVFAVWDFMSLLKTLQRGLTCVELPWRPRTIDKRLTRLINEIVLGEESDLTLDGQPMDHFSLYLGAMEEVGAQTSAIHDFMESLDFSKLTPAVAEFTRFNLKLSLEAPLFQVAAAFFYGREKLIPDMFKGLLLELKKNQHPIDQLLYYIERHIEIDSGEHGPLAHECLNILCENDPQKLEIAYKTGLESLRLRSLVWDEVLELKSQMSSKYS